MKTLTNEAWKVMTQYQGGKYMELSESDTVPSTRSVICRYPQKDSKGVQCGDISLDKV